MSTSTYAFFASSPFLFVNVLHRPASEVGAYYMVIVAGITGGSWLASRVAAASSVVLPIAAALGILGAGGLLLIDQAGWLSVTSILVTVCIFSVGTGIVSPLATARAIGADTRAIGAASGLYGFLQMSFGAFCTLWVGVWHTESALSTACIMLAAAVLAQIAFLVGRDRG
jgi:DHA1 family bicyclomycin/chloramphenicol resistance-like MFS transporter